MTPTATFAPSTPAPTSSAACWRCWPASGPTPVTNAESIAFLRPLFLRRARALGLNDLDAATLKDARPRVLTQQIATYIYGTTDLDGVQFLSRHGDEHTLWAIFERPDDPDISRQLHDPVSRDLTTELPEMLEAFRIHHLAWSDD